ncbi:hypothetical protein ACIHCX_03400 [Streptomyces sp. NPDC052043]|uniref:hypothetical protein n=1 Tax=Streptomyces sp. NPDC052043 TaxID=3365684 RepID=UPI0037CE44DF
MTSPPRMTAPLPPAPVEPLVEPGPPDGRWEETAREAAREDAAYWDAVYDTEPDDPSDHYHY